MLKMLAQPAGRGAGIAAPKAFVQIGQIGPDRPVQAARIDIAKRIGREIAEQAHRPVNVLQHAIGGPVHGDAEIGLEAVVPGAFQLPRRQIAADQAAFQIEAHHDVEVILHLIRFGADITRRDAVDGGVERLGILRARHPEGVLHLVEYPAGKGAAAAKLVFVDPALAFMDAHGRTAPDGGEKVIGVHGLLIGRMADLMDGGVKTVQRLRLHHPRGDAHVIA